MEEVSASAFFAVEIWVSFVVVFPNQASILIEERIAQTPALSQGPEWVETVWRGLSFALGCW